MEQRAHPGHSYIDDVDPDEVTLSVIKKHPFGIILVFIQAFIGIILSVSLAFLLLPTILEENTAFNLATLFMVAALFVAAIIVIGSFVIYQQNKLIITDRNITQVLQAGLFSRKVSQLNMVNVEDVTSEQHGILCTLLGYGTLKIETAGEQVNFHYTFCPRPNYYAKIILDARESYTYPNSGRGGIVPPNSLNRPGNRTTP